MKRSGPIKRKKPLPRSSAKLKRRKTLAKSNAYCRPEWRALARKVRLRSKGVCEMRIACAGDPATGDPHHLSYGPESGWRRLIVPLDQLVAVCRRCHVQAHASPPPPIDFLDAL
jgi:hypothetical protein